MNQPLQTAPASSQWKSRTALFLTGQTISLFGSALVQFAIIWYITLTTQSGVMTTISTVCGFLPQVAISLFSGVWADRHNRKFLIIAADMMTAASTLALALCFLFGFEELWLIFLVSGIRSVGAGIQTPAVNALLPQIVPPDKLIKVGGINGSLNSLTVLIAPAVGGAVMSTTSMENVFFVDVGTAILATVLLLFLKVPPHKRATEKITTGYFDDLKIGVNYVWSKKFFRAFFLFYALFFFLLVPAAQLTPLMTTRTFGEEVWRLTLIEVIFSGGSVLGGAAIATWGGFKNRTFSIAFAATIFGIITVLMGLPVNFVTLLIFMGLAGLMVPLMSTPAMVLLQERVPSDMQGRVFSLVQIIMTSAMPLGMVVFGPLADSVRIQVLLIGTGILTAVLGASMFFNRHFRHVDDELPPIPIPERSAAPEAVEAPPES